MTVESVLAVCASRAQDFSQVRDLLAAVPLPIEDLDTTPGLRLWVVEDQDRTVLEQEARAKGIEVLAVLTETAEAFFKRHGYEVIERAYVPDEIRQGAEFQALCPASAVCMAKSLESSPVAAPHA
jgi:hypothetical protein